MVSAGLAAGERGKGGLWSLQTGPSLSSCRPQENIIRNGLLQPSRSWYRAANTVPPYKSGTTVAPKWLEQMGLFASQASPGRESHFGISKFATPPFPRDTAKTPQSEVACCRLLRCFNPTQTGIGYPYLGKQRASRGFPDAVIGPRHSPTHPKLNNCLD